MYIAGLLVCKSLKLILIPEWRWLISSVTENPYMYMCACRYICTGTFSIHVQELYVHVLENVPPNMQPNAPTFNLCRNNKEICASNVKLVTWTSYVALNMRSFLSCNRCQNTCNLLHMKQLFLIYNILYILSALCVWVCVSDHCQF